MARTTALLVGGLIDVDPDYDLTPFIDTANELVSEVCAPVTTYTTTRLELIERWLAAHFYAILDPRAISEGANFIIQRIESQVDLGFDVTRYGQQAMRLDTNGGLAKLNEDTKKGGKRKVSIHWLGKTTEELEAD